ncbi:hypothetical protein ACWIUD_00875 [Helicobacter sp. 23-1044]
MGIFRIRFCEFLIFLLDSAIFCIFFVIARFCVAKSWQSIILSFSREVEARSEESLLCEAF